MTSQAVACRRGIRTETSIVVETAQCVSTHHVAMLIGYGAHAVLPYLALESARAWRTSTRCAKVGREGEWRMRERMRGQDEMEIKRIRQGNRQ